MVTSDLLSPLRRRALRHVFEDGAIDLLLGFFTLLVGIGTQRHVFLALSVVYLGTLALAWRTLHDRLTVGRTGYAEVPGDPPRQLLSVVLIAGCLTMTIVAAMTLPAGRLWALERWPAWAPMLSGLVLAAGFLHTAWQSGLARYGVYGVLGLAASLFFWLYPFGPRINASDRLTLSLFTIAAVLLAGGAVTLFRFLRERPVLAGEVAGER